MILESKEALYKTINTQWDTILAVDLALEDAVQELQQAHKNIRSLIRRENDARAMAGSPRVGSTTELGPRSKDEAERLLRMPTRT